MKKKDIIAYITKLICHDNCHSIINNISHLCLIVKLLVKDAVFDYQPGKKNNKSEFINLYFYKIKFIVIRGLLNLYQYRIYRNKKLRL